MIEGLILACELVVFALLLWNVRQLDGRPPSRSLGLFDMSEPKKANGETSKPKVPHA
jgi:hypothetical protein